MILIFSLRVGHFAISLERYTFDVASLIVNQSFFIPLASFKFYSFKLPLFKKIPFWLTLIRWQMDAQSFERIMRHQLALYVERQLAVASKFCKVGCKM